MESIRKHGTPTAETIARLADKGEDVSRFFTNKGRMMSPIQRVKREPVTGNELDDSKNAVAE